MFQHAATSPNTVVTESAAQWHGLQHDGTLFCRHYVDRICRYTTGVNAATALCKRHVYNLSRQQVQWSDSLVAVAQVLTDVANWPRVKAATQVSSPLLMQSPVLACICSKK